MKNKVAGKKGHQVRPDALSAGQPRHGGLPGQSPAKRDGEPLHPPARCSTSRACTPTPARPSPATSPAPWPSNPFLRQAEDTGIPNSLCSYHKIFIRAAQRGLMPKPQFILSTSLACDASTLTFRHMAEFYGVPHFALDVPFESSPRR